jgi:20S proteasome subunit beta 5
MNRFVSRYSSSPLQLPQEENFGQICGKWDAAQQLAFPSFDIPAVANVSSLCIIYFTCLSSN